MSKQTPPPLPPKGGSGGGQGGGPPSNPFDGQIQQPNNEPKKEDDKEDKWKWLNKTSKGVEQYTRLANHDYIGVVKAIEGLPEPVKRFADALDGAIKTILSRTEDLKGYNGPMAEASAKREIALIKADMREADTVGDSYAKATNEWTDLEVSLRDMFAPLLDAGANIIGTLLEIVNFLKRFSLLPEAIQAISFVLNLLADGVSAIVEFGDDIASIPGRIVDGLKPWGQSEEDRQKDNMALVDRLFKNTERQFAGMPKNGPPMPRPAGPNAAPAF